MQKKEINFKQSVRKRIARFYDFLGTAKGEFILYYFRVFRYSFNILHKKLENKIKKETYSKPIPSKGKNQPFVANT